jgi:hypothetical protein
LEVWENFFITEKPYGSYDSSQKVYEFTVNVQEPNGVSYQWFYGEDELSDGDVFSGVTTSKLLVDNLSPYDPSGFKVRVRKGDSSRFIDASYQLGPDDYYSWAESMGLEGARLAPETDGLGTGYPNLFAFLQGLRDSRDFQHPTLSRSGPYVSIRFKTTKDWRQEQLSVLFASDLKEDALALRPKVVQETPDYFVWESLANAGLDQSSFFYLSVEISE